MTHYRRRTLEAWEEAAALAAGAVVGLGAAYLVRIWLRRSPTGGAEARRDEPAGQAGRRTAVPGRTEAGPGRPR